MPVLVRSNGGVWRRRWGLAGALLLCVEGAAGCHESSITEAERPLVAAVFGAVYAPDGSPVAGATVRVEARRSNMHLVSSASAVTNANGEFAVSMQTRGVAGVMATAFVRATPPTGMAVADGYTRGARLFFGAGADGAATRVDVVLGTESVRAE